eukprot:TRINITY_DN9860_c1_g1_i1.p1 TRINITY_DN9860_c1_g1~~TRINITY_DN9860_c1_g1_i1.p1  ORF type:complete len:312 (-),score=103.21 TRINITY_DN9860_c1_g1_i1:82-951(-)
MALSLAIRKGIRDSEPKKVEHLEKIKNATGVDFTFEVDFGAILAQIPADKKADYGDRIGEVLHDWYLSPLAYGIERNVSSDEMKKEALVTACTAKKISFAILPDAEWKKAGYGSYARIRVVNGVLFMEVKPDTFCANVDNVCQDFEKCFAGEGGLSLKTRASIRDTESERADLLKAISDAAGHTYTFECDWDALTPAINARGYEERHGEVVNWHLGGAKYHLVKLLGDEMGKEAFVDATPSRVIKFVVDPKAAKGKLSKFENGAWVLVVKPDSLASNVDETGSDVESLL